MDKKIAFIIVMLTSSKMSMANMNNINCWENAAQKYSLDPILLYSIAQVESSLVANPKKNKNKNGTYDIGIMQINSSHLKTLEKQGIREDDLINPCINIHVGAWILRSSIEIMGDLQKGIGAYNAGTNKKCKKREKLRTKYANKVIDRYNRNIYELELRKSRSTRDKNSKRNSSSS